MTEIAEVGLKACPLCGEAGCAVEADGRWFATCCSIDCRICVGEGYDAYACPDHAFATEAEAITAWNTRARQPDPRVSALVEALERIAKLTPKAANAGTAHELYCSVSAIAETALATFKEVPTNAGRLGDALRRDHENGTDTSGESERGD